MKRLHRLLLRSLPGPFTAAFGTLLFLLLMQFLINYLPELVGRGLPAGIIAELIAYSLAYMVVLAVPMAVLVATLLVAAGLAETQAYAVAKSAGISLLGLTWPVFVVAVLTAGGMTYFNNVVLPEANFRMKGLWQDIRQKKPGFELEPGVFYDGIQGYAIRVADAPAESNALREVLVFDDSEAGQRATITAARGTMAAGDPGALEMLLDDGEIHRLSSIRDDGERTERYERIAFARHRLRLDLSDLGWERSDAERTSRSDRTMRTGDMIALVDSLDATIASRTADLREDLATLGRRETDLGPPVHSLPTVTADTASADTASAGTERGDSSGVASPLLSALREQQAKQEVSGEALPLLETQVLTDSATQGDSAAAGATANVRPSLAGLGSAERLAVYTLAVQRARTVRSSLDAAETSVAWEQQRADRYRVEIYKKFSMAVACIVFALVGIPLGLSVRRGGLGLIGVLAVGLFLFYWITLVQGEKLADRGLLAPGVGMWAANVLIGGLGVYLFARESRDPAARDPLRRLLARLRR